MLNNDIVTRTLTRNGTIPLEHIFLIDNQINIWIPSMRWFVSPRIRSSEVANACRQFLRDTGRVADSIVAAEDSVQKSASPEPRDGAPVTACPPS